MGSLYRCLVRLLKVIVGSFFFVVGFLLFLVLGLWLVGFLLVVFLFLVCCLLVFLLVVDFSLFLGVNGECRFGCRVSV